MIMTELQEIVDYWMGKYPEVDIKLYPKHDDGRFRGKMLTHNNSLDLEATTIGELINQGESFLRKVR